MNFKKLFSRRPVVSAIRLSGVIKSGKDSLSLEHLQPSLDKLFAKSRQKAVALVINSPGGSPVQSSLIGKYIEKLSNETNIPVIAFVEDMAASGGYWLACAADEIYADENSIVGSIGVIGGGFGFHEFIKKHGIERRIYTSGENKSKLDMFQPEKPEDVESIKELQKEIHENFINHVKTSRNVFLGSASSENLNKLFNGDFWTGRTAFKLGLIDGISDINSHFGNNVRIRWIETNQGGWLKRKVGFGINLLFNKIENYVLASKFGV